MQNKNIKIQFAERLRELMVHRGFSSPYSSSGVSPSALSKAIGCFTEMSLRYLDGRAIPNPENILKIAKWLDVEPGFLLFGDQATKSITQDKSMIKIDKDFLEYSLKKITNIMNDENKDEFLAYFINILMDLSHLQIPPDQLKKIFDLTLKSPSFIRKDIQIGNIDNGKSRKISSKITS